MGNSPLAIFRDVRTFRLVLVCGALLSAALPLETAHANAHCFCKLGPPVAPIHDFGQIATFPTQIGHDTYCMNLCITTADPYMSNGSSTQASACIASHGGTITTNSAVGTKSYQTGKTYTCPPSNTTPTPGRLLFGTTLALGRSLDINGVGVNIANPSPVNVPNIGSFTTFTLNDFLSFHLQAWTYEAKLYRDNALVEQLSNKSPGAFGGSVLVQFTGQSNNFVHGHDWRVEWRYFGPNFSNGSVSFHIQ